MIVVDARQRVKRLDAVGNQGGDDRLGGGGFVHSQRLGSRFAADVQIGLALSRGGVFPFRRGSANTPSQFLARHAPRKRGITYPQAVAISLQDFGRESGGYWIVRFRGR